MSRCYQHVAVWIQGQVHHSHVGQPVAERLPPPAIIQGAKDPHIGPDIEDARPIAVENYGKHGHVGQVSADVAPTPAAVCGLEHVPGRLGRVAIETVVDNVGRLGVVVGNGNVRDPAVGQRGLGRVGPTPACVRCHLHVAVGRAYVDGARGRRRHGNG